MLRGWGDASGRGNDVEVVRLMKKIEQIRMLLQAQLRQEVHGPIEWIRFLDPHTPAALGRTYRWIALWASHAAKLVSRRIGDTCGLSKITVLDEGNVANGFRS